MSDHDEHQGDQPQHDEHQGDQPNPNPDEGIEEAAQVGNEEQEQASDQPQSAAEGEARPADQVDTPEGLTRVQILTSCRIIRNDGTTQTFTAEGTNCGLPGFYDVSEADASHWYLQAHSSNPPPPLPPMPGTAAAVQIEAQKAARRRQLESVLDEEEQAAAVEIRKKRQGRMRRALGDNFEQSPNY